MDWNVLWWLLATLLVLAGLAGTILPALPGVPLVFAGLFVLAFMGVSLYVIFSQIEQRVAGWAMRKSEAF